MSCCFFKSRLGYLGWLPSVSPRDNWQQIPGTFGRLFWDLVASHHLFHFQCFYRVNMVVSHQSETESKCAENWIFISGVCLFLPGERWHSEGTRKRSPGLRLPRLLLRHFCKLSQTKTDYFYHCYAFLCLFSLLYCPPSSSLPLLPQLLAVFRFATLILAYAVCKLRHWWAIAVSFPPSALRFDFISLSAIVQQLMIKTKYFLYYKGSFKCCKRSLTNLYYTVIKQRLDTHLDKWRFYLGALFLNIWPTFHWWHLKEVLGSI